LTPLYGLWLVSLTIASAALCVMLGLIVARLWSVRHARARADERRRIAPMVMAGDLAAIDGPVDRHLLADLSAELIDMVRGDDRATFVASAERMGVPDEFRSRLKRGNARQRVIAAEALSAFPDDVSRDSLQNALGDRSADVRLAAAMALALQGAAPPARLLVDRLSLGTREHSLVMVSLFEEIARTRPDEIRALVLEEDVADTVKAAAIEAVATSGDYALVPVIGALALATDPASPVMARYLRLLGRFEHPAGAPAVRAGMGNPGWAARAATAEAAGRIGIADAREALSGLLDDHHWAVRFAAAEALARLGAAGLACLRAAADGASPRAREAAIQILAEKRIAS
jgi:HEAT repeat protein